MDRGERSGGRQHTRGNAFSRRGPFNIAQGVDPREQSVQCSRGEYNSSTFLLSPKVLMRNRLERIIKILKLLSTRVPYNPMQLAQETGANRRTIFRDIAALKSLGIPILMDDKSNNYSLGEIRGGNDWLQQLLENQRTVDEKGVVRSHNLQSREGRQKYATELLAMLPDSVVDQLRENLLSASDSKSKPLKSISDLIIDLAAAIRGATPLTIVVRNDFEKPTLVTIVPHRIEFHANGWRLMGIDSTNAEIWLDINPEAPGSTCAWTYTFSFVIPTAFSSLQAIEDVASNKSRLSN